MIAIANIYRVPATYLYNPKCFKYESESCSVVSNSFWSYGLIVPGILQARILEWVAFPFSRESSQPKDRTQVPPTAGRFFTSWATREAQQGWSG